MNGPQAAPLRIGYVTIRDPSLHKSWSGSTHALREALARNVGEVVPIGPMPAGLTTAEKRLSTLLNAGLRPFGRSYVTHANVTDPVTAYLYGRVVRRRVARAGVDVVVAASDAPAMAYAKLDVPFVYVDDSCFAALDGYLPRYRNVARTAAAMFGRVQERTMRRAAAVVLTSQWAADAAVRAHGLDPARTHVVPFGATVRPRDHTPPEPPSRDDCRILFVGLSWLTKGGPEAVGIVRALRRRGVDATMTACGLPGSVLPQEPWVRHTGLIDLDRPGGHDTLARHYRDAHVVLVPARAEAFGIALCEAAAFGLPALVTGTGGNGAVILDGVTGFRLPPVGDPGGDPDDYAAAIEQLVGDPVRYRAMSAAARRRHETDLNWDTAARRIGAIAEHVRSGQARRENAGAN